MMGLLREMLADKHIWCGPCNDGVCDSMGCSMPGICSCPEHDEDDEETGR